MSCFPRILLILFQFLFFAFPFRAFLIPVFLFSFLFLSFYSLFFPPKAYFPIPLFSSLYFLFLCHLSPFPIFPCNCQHSPPPPFSFTQMLRISRAPAVLEFGLERNYLARRHCSALHSLLRLIELQGRENPKPCLQLSESDDDFVSSGPESLM